MMLWVVYSKSEKTFWVGGLVVVQGVIQTLEWTDAGFPLFHLAGCREFDCNRSKWVIPQHDYSVQPEEIQKNSSVWLTEPAADKDGAITFISSAGQAFTLFPKRIDIAPSKH